ncbi:MAG: hypothetical protein ACOC2V_01335 [Alkalispirochaeta sp.]
MRREMRRCRRGLLLGTLMIAQWITTVPSLPGQTFDAERIAVVPFVNTTGVEQWDALGRAMAETIELTLRLSGQFDLAEIPGLDTVDPYAPDGPVRLREIAEEHRLDAAIVGRISDLENGRVELQAAAYSAVTGSIIGEETREAFGSFDILDAADELVILASSAFLGYHVDFGGIILQPSRGDVPYVVYIDGVPVGRSIASVPQVLTGRRTIEIAVVTGRGEQYVYSADRLIRPGEAIEIAIGLPAVTNVEQVQIRASHDLARNLLGQPEQYLTAFDALSAGRQLLRESTSTALDPLRDIQSELETLWQLDEELYRLRPDVYGPEGEYERGRPLSVMNGTAALAESYQDGEEHPEIRRRIVRNGAAQYHLLHLAWAAALGRADWNQAEAILADMETVSSHYGLENQTAFRRDRSAWNMAKQEAETVSRRRRRPWPYLGLAAGLGGLGYGGYYLATDQVDGYTDKGDDYDDESDLATTEAEAESLREKADEQYDRAEEAEIIQWTSIAAGGVVAILSTWRIFANRRADETFLHDWAQENYGGEIALADRLFSDEIVARFGPTPTDELHEDESETTLVLVLGPAGEVVHVEDRPRVFPFLQEIERGRSLVTDRPPVVDGDRTRIYSDPFALTVLR